MSYCCSSLARAALAGLVALTLLVGPVSVSRAAETPARDKAAVAKCTAITGALFEKTAPGIWQPLKAGAEVPAGKLLVALPRADLRSRNGAVELMLLADVGQRGLYPVLESAVVVNEDPAVDLDVTLVRGIIGLTNRKPKGPATVRLRFRGTTWNLTLLEPGALAGAELYARHPPGLPTLRDGKVEEPTVNVVLRVVKGQAFVDMDGVGHRLQAPPGPAQVVWHSVDRRPEIQRLEKVPPSLLPQDDKERAVFGAVAAASRSLTERPLGAALEGLVKSDKKVDRLVGVTWMGALDQLPQLLDALADARHADVRDQAILVLRQWVGRNAGQVGKLYQALKEHLHNSDVTARTVVQLLFGFNDEERAQPATYELLIGDLMHKQLPVRELAHWHLVRLAPTGRDIPYDAAGSEAQRRRAAEQWQALIPEGRLPPRPKAPPPEKK
jgi:hypothetical protein